MADPKTEYRYRTLAAIPARAFEAEISKLRGAGREPTQTALLRLAPKPAKAKPPRRADTLVADFARRAMPDTDDDTRAFAVGAIAQVVGIAAEPRGPLERAELLLRGVADHLEGTVLERLDSDSKDRVERNGHDAVKGAVGDLREHAVVIERTRLEQIAPRDRSNDTSYGRPFRRPLPRNDA